MTADELKALPISEKIQIMETIWEDLRDRFEHLGLPDELKELLDQRRARVRNGSAQLLDWDTVKANIGRP
jgi:putative addiction module component (TIGR02574 family)